MEWLKKFLTNYYETTQDGWDRVSEMASNAWLVLQNIIVAMFIFPLWLIGKRK